MDTICSGCGASADMSKVHKIPAWNPEYKTVWLAYRCDECFEEAFRITLEAVEQIDATVLAAFASFMENMQLSPFDELMRMGTPEDWQPFLRKFLQRLREEERRAVAARRAG